MGKHVVETNYHRLDPVGQNEMCKNCSSTCKTSCAHHPAHNMGSDRPYFIDDQPKVIAKRFYDVTIKDVESIPCELKGQILKYDVDGNRLEGELDTPWPMTWTYGVIEDYLKKDTHFSGVKVEEFHNPEEDDQKIVCEINSYIERQ